MEPNSEIRDRPKRRWWLAIVFVALVIAGVIALDWLSKPKAPPYAFLCESKHLSSDESIGPGISRRMMYVLYNRSIIDEPFGVVHPKAEAELFKLGFSIASRSKDHVEIRNVANGQFVVLLNEGSRTRAQWNVVRPYTGIDRARIWLHSFIARPPEAIK